MEVAAVKATSVETKLNMSTQPANIEPRFHPRDEKTLTLRRRQFVASSLGGFLLGFLLDGAEERADAQVSSSAMNGYIQIGSDSSVTIIFGGCEMGQGAMTGLAQCAAEDLMVDWSAVKITTALNSPISYTTGGSSAIRKHASILRAAGATARDMLIQAAANSWGVAPSSCTAAHGVVTGPSGQTATYGSLAAAASILPVPTNSSLVSPANFRIIGQPIARPDIPSKVNGSAIFGIDVRVPNMLFAVIHHCPTIGGTLASTPAVPQGALYVVPVTTPDTRGGVTMGTVNAVAVVATNTWAAKNAASNMNVKWNIPANAASITDATHLAAMQSLMGATTGVYVAESVGNVTTALASSAKTVSAQYSFPYCAHAVLEPLNCTASVTKDSLGNVTGCEIWVPTQSATGAASYAAAVCGLTPAQVIVHTTLLGGGLGRKGEQDYVSQAVQVSKALGQPVKLTWPREEDFAHDQYRPTALVNVSAGIDSSGNVTAFHARNVSQSILAQRGYAYGPIGDSQATEGTTALRYNFASRLSEWVPFAGLVPVGFWRSVGCSINAFAVESMIDELAFAAGIDPFTFRQTLLAGDARASALMAAADTASSWRKSMPAGHAYGMAFAESFGTLVIHVVDVSSQTTAVKSGTTSTTVASAKVNRVATIVDCSYAINPNQVEAQMQGGIVHGMGAALWSGVGFNAGVASVRNYNQYRLVKGGDMPTVTVTIVNSDPITAIPSGGIGEPAVPPVAPAIANAWFRLTGARLRSLPLFPSLANSGGD